MSEHHHITAPARGEPLTKGRVGARVRVPLSGAPSAAWAQLMTGHLTASLVGHGPVGHLQCGGSVQGTEIVLEGVEDAEAERLGEALREAVDAANRAATRLEPPAKPRNMDQARADRVAADLGLPKQGAQPAA